jgi:hypothetical protein
MKKKILIFVAILLPILATAQKNNDQYKTIIYTDLTLANDIQEEIPVGGVVSFDSKILSAAEDAAKGIGAGYVTSFMNMGVNAVASLLTRNSRHKAEWEKMIEEENTWTTQINTIEEAKDFYRKKSFEGALDPSSMYFNGIGCLRMEDKDTVFYVSCHIDRTKLNEIIDHSKFQLTLDTLILSPKHSRLPNTQLPIEYSLDERKNFCLSVNIKLSSSWFTKDIVLHKDIPLGEFNINVMLDPKALDERGFLRYVRKNGEKSKYEVTGESFVVPRSYMCLRTPSGEIQDVWGTGQYNVQIILSENCEITDKLRHEWKDDRRRHKAMKPKTGILRNVWQTVSKQKWDELSQQWIITTLTAPANVVSKDIIDKLGLDTDDDESNEQPQK